jgi:hypothetical protein
MHEELMEQVVTQENATAGWLAVKRNGGAPGIDGMTTEQLRDHVRKHWETIRAKMLAGTYVPSPVRRVERPKPHGGVRLLGIPTVLDRWIQQMLLQVLQALFDPTFSAHSFGFRPGKSAHDAVRESQSYDQAGKAWVVDMDITKFFDRAKGRCVQPPDAENRTSGGVGGCRSAIPGTRPVRDLGNRLEVLESLAVVRCAGLFAFIGATVLPALLAAPLWFRDLIDCPARRAIAALAFTM